MSFIDDARQFVADLPEGDPMRLTLEYLLENAVGYDNPVLINTVIGHLATRRVDFTREEFQHAILGESRHGETTGDIFIGIRNRRGIYLIETEHDARETWNFYNDRIRSEETHRDHLADLMEREGWERPQN